MNQIQEEAMVAAFRDDKEGEINLRTAVEMMSDDELTALNEAVSNAYYATIHEKDRRELREGRV